MKSYKEMFVWQKAMELSESTYRLVKLLPSSEEFGLKSQMRRASVSIASNLAEGFGKNTRNELKNYCRIATGSAMELETQLLLIQRLGLVSKTDIDRVSLLLQSVLRLLRLLHRSLTKTVKMPLALKHLST